MDPYALKAWCWQVLATANRDRPHGDHAAGTVTTGFLKQAAR